MNKAHHVTPKRLEFNQVENNAGKAKVSVRKEQGRRASEGVLPKELHLDIESEEDIVDEEC